MRIIIDFIPFEKLTKITVGFTKDEPAIPDKKTIDFIRKMTAEIGDFLEEKQYAKLYSEVLP